MQRLVWVLALLCLVAADAFARDLDANYDPAAGARRNRGVVVLSMTMSPRDGDPHWDKASLTVWYQKVNSILPHWLDMPADHKARRDAPSEFSTAYGQLRVFEVGAGEYELGSFTYRGYSEGRAQIGGQSWDSTPLRFTVRPGRVTYLGRMHLDEFIVRSKAPEYYSALHGATDYFGVFGWLRFLDARDEDLPALASRYPGLTKDLVDFSDAAPGSWTRTWVREAACMSQAPASLFEATLWNEHGNPGTQLWNAYRTTQPGGVFAWQRDFREFALTLTTCSRVRLGAQSSIATLQWSLRNAEVRWEGVVREVSLVGDAVSLMLDTQTSDLPVAVPVAGWEFQPPSAPLNCCVVSGELESWRKVQVGDVIAVIGTLDPLEPLRFSLDLKVGAKTPVMPVLRNARAEVLRRP